MRVIAAFMTALFVYLAVGYLTGNGPNLPHGGLHANQVVDPEGAEVAHFIRQTPGSWLPAFPVEFRAHERH